MLSYLKREEEFLYDPHTPIEIKEGTNFFDILGKFFLTELNAVLKKGLLRKYVRKQESQRFIKGKLLIQNQIRKNLINKTKFFCEFEDLTFDNLENQVVMSAIHSLISLIKFNQPLKRELKRLEVILKDYISLRMVSLLNTTISGLIGQTYTTMN
jgi:5-methylcytosine-specific restriction enzyme subunit McrC